MHLHTMLRVAILLLAGLGLHADETVPPAVAPPAIAAPGAYALVHGRRMYYEVHGAGPPLVLLHGGGNTILGSFARQIPLFAQTHRVIGLEQFGHGHSDDVDGELSYSRMADDTAELLRQLHVFHADIVGWSDGGIIGLILAARHPELVRRLVVSGANLRPDGVRPEFLDPPPALTGPSAAAAAAAPDRAAVMQRKLKTLWSTAPTAADVDERQLARIQAPTLVMAGENDIIRPEHTREIARLIPHARLCIIPGATHATFSSRPDLVNPIILSFLAGPADKE
ncbi:MAG TPA: alpha/beta hydrolase [Opitutaceae bacterium]|nr:alpha/beta hydrolase [Opitutaceae bacterium]